MQATVTCDSSVVKGYLLTSEITIIGQKLLKYDTSEYTCGDRVRIEQMKGVYIILI